MNLAIIIALVISYLLDKKAERRKTNAEAKKLELENKLLELKIKHKK